jgi:hypothetical protein
LHSILWALVRMEIINKMWRVGLLSDLTITLLSSYHPCMRRDSDASKSIFEPFAEFFRFILFLFDYSTSFQSIWDQICKNISSGLGQSYELRKRAPWIGFIIRTIHQSRNSQSRFAGNFSLFDPCSCSFKIQPNKSTGNPADLKLESDRVKKK